MHQNNTMISFGVLPKTLIYRSHHQSNSMTELTLEYADGNENVDSTDGLVTHATLCATKG